ncbi:hypothetical protein [Virgisporangium aurantiacum]|uniref:Uncharacterized protein n=1 Tax=Virgisporangium aurantiacum TaxID=175570 RepID=A0A8J4E6S8_9ACTN|nr:hypothetical protein [Virgisporangium aurantiacum]GIJ64405.1 hypothetical protein Vau01_119210 [Virgisporangium aurantiacum]
MIPDDVPEDQIDGLPLDVILAVDGRALRRDLVARLRKLPYPAYLGCLSLCIDDIRTMYGERVFGPGEQLVNRTLELIRAAATGAAVKHSAKRLWRQWLDYMGNPGPEQLADTDLPVMVRSPCTTAVLELIGPQDRDAASTVADAAYKGNRETNLIPGDNVRRLMKFIAWTRKAES